MSINSWLAHLFGALTARCDVPFAQVAVGTVPTLVPTPVPTYPECISDTCGEQAVMLEGKKLGVMVRLTQ
jgi:hypothetical protein